MGSTELPWCSFTKVTATGKPQVDEASLSEMRDVALQQGNDKLHEECEMFIRLLTLQKWLGQLSEGANSWFNTIEKMAVFTTAVPSPQSLGEMLTVVPTWGRSSLLLGHGYLYLTLEW